MLWYFDIAHHSGHCYDNLLLSKRFNIIKKAIIRWCLYFLSSPSVSMTDPIFNLDQFRTWAGQLVFFHFLSKIGGCLSHSFASFPMNMIIAWLYCNLCLFNQRIKWFFHSIFFRFFYSLNHIFPSISIVLFFLYYSRNYKADRPTGLKLIDFLPVSFCIQFFSNFISNAIILFPVQRTGNLKWNQDTQEHIEHHSEALTPTGMLEPHCEWKPTNFTVWNVWKGSIRL